MWHDAAIVLRTCPVRELTAAAEHVLGLFRLCYTRRFTAMSPPMWERTAWPRGTTLEDQDAWTTAALNYTCDVMNRAEIDDWNEASKNDAK